MSAHDVLAAIALTAAAAAVVRLTWKLRTVSAFLAGAAAGAAVFVEPAAWALESIVLAAVTVGACFAVRTRGYRSDDGKPTAWLARLGASWLVLSFPAATVWLSLQAAHCMLHRM